MKTTLDLSYLKTMAAGDPATMKTLLQALQQELRNNLLKARKLYKAQDWKGLDRFCHHFKSTISFSGHKGLINTNLALWEVAKGNADRSQGAALITQLEKYGKEVGREAAKVLKDLK